MTDQENPNDRSETPTGADGPIVNTPDGTPLEASTVDPATGAPGVDSTAQEAMEHGHPTGDAVGAAAGAGAFVQTSPMYTGSPHEANPDRHNRMRDVVGDTVVEGLVAQAYGALTELETAEATSNVESRRAAEKRLYAAGMGDSEIAAARRRLDAANRAERGDTDAEEARNAEPRDRRAPAGSTQTTAPDPKTPAKKATPAKTTTAKTTGK